jgi:hypothetical protein
MMEAAGMKSKHFLKNIIISAHCKHGLLLEALGVGPNG